MELLDKKDRRLLHSIDLNARDSFAALGRRIGLYKETTANRLHRLQELQIVCGFNVVLDISQLGYTGYGVYVRLESSTQSTKARLIEDLKRNSKVYWVANIGGNYDLLLAIQAANAVEFMHTLNRIQARHRIIRSTSIATRIFVTQFRRDYLVALPTQGKELTFTASTKTTPIDELDRKILHELVGDPRVSIVALASRLGVTRLTAQRRLKRLEQRGIVQGYTALIDCTKYGYEGYNLLLTLHRSDAASRKKILDFARNNPSITFFVDTIGAWQIELSCEVMNQQELHRLLTSLRAQHEAIIANIEIVMTFEFYVKYQQHA